MKHKNLSKTTVRKNTRKFLSMSATQKRTPTKIKKVKYAHGGGYYIMHVPSQGVRVKGYTKKDGTRVKGYTR